MTTTVLCILDGYGISSQKEGNAIATAKKPHIDKIFETHGMVKGLASGEAVGLPSGQMGNSEVGHLNIGAGRIVYQDLTRINKSIEDGSFYTNESLLKAIENVKKNHSTFHIMGLISDGGVHTHIKHCFALLELAKKNQLDKVMVHCFMDGRDVKPDSGTKFIKELQEKIKELGVGKVASICGRYFAMDRDKNYDRVKLAYNLLTKGKGAEFIDPIEAIESSYKDGVMDEFIKPITIDNKNHENDIRDNDSIVFFNFRPDRAREITHAFVDDDFTFFDRTKLKNIIYVCMTEYDPTIKNKLVAFVEKDIKNHIGEVVSKLGMKQLRTAETEKYAHVTFFFNGGKEAPFEGEDRILVPSPKEVPTYDLKPEMSAYQVCDNVVKALDSDKYDFIVVNFANPDMVGHTGVFDACVKAIETVDSCVGQIYDKVMEKKANLMIIADHGNADVMKDTNGKVVTSHTTNPVPFCLVSQKNLRLKEDGRLCDVAPTLLKLMNIEKPVEMEGISLI